MVAMRRAKLIGLALAGVVLPVALVFSAYLIASGSIGVAGTVPPVPQHRVTDDSSPSPESTKANRPGRGDGDAPDDRGGRCSEPEHADDPECDSSGSDSDSSDSSGSSGSGSGGDGDDSESDSSGKGSGDDSSNSGPGGEDGDD